MYISFDAGIDKSILRWYNHTRMKKIFFVKKSLSALNNIERTECETEAATVGAFIEERVRANYKPSVGLSLGECIESALVGFKFSAFYIVNTTKDIKYGAADEDMRLDDGDEIALIKLKYVRGVVW